MKILSAEQIRALDKYTIEHNNISSVGLMEHAASKFVGAISHLIKKDQPIYIFCGVGNNGGDGLASARILYLAGYKKIYCYIVRHSANASADFTTNEQRLKDILELKYITSEKEIPAIQKDAIIIDAIFGTGLSRPAEGLSASVIAAINQTDAIIYSIDMPSGLYCDEVNGETDAIIQPDTVYTFHSPKLSFLFPQNEKYIPEFKVLDIGLSKEYENSLAVTYEYINEAWIKSAFHQRKKFSHKGTYGHALICAGSYGKMGAAVLSVSAALKSGAGLVTAYIPQCGYEIMQISNPEAMVITDANQNTITAYQDFSKFTTIGIGPGIGTEKPTVDFIETLFRKEHRPLVLDADALNIIAEYHHLRDLLPHNSILTPHPGEFKRLVGGWENDLQKLQQQIDFSQRYKVVLVLKGAHTTVSTPEGKVYFNSTGNPGMAKGGSGDVLTGIITSILAQGYTSDIAAIIGVYVHGLAGDMAAKELSQTGIMASDIIKHLPKAFSALEHISDS